MKAKLIFIGKKPNNFFFEKKQIPNDDLMARVALMETIFFGALFSLTASFREMAIKQHNFEKIIS